MVRSVVLVALMLVSASGVAHAVAVTPSALYIDARSRTGSLTLFNPGTRPEEIEIGFAFGYPQADAQGNVSISLQDEAPAGEPSAVGWLRAFPRRLILQPGERQVVRIMVQPPADLPAGEYWARVLIRSQGGQPPVEQTDGQVRVQINVQTVVVTALSFRKGAVHTGLTVAAPEARVRGDSVALMLDLERTGNAAFLGRVQAEVLDTGGRVVGKIEEDLAVYRAMRRRIAIPLTEPRSAAGGYRVRYRIDTERPDLPAEGPLPAPEQSGTVGVAQPS